MIKHYSEADLLETYYMQPGQSMPVMMHLAECRDCAARYERLEHKLREAASCHTDRPESFWSRQRRTIMLSISARRERSTIAVRTWRAAAAAILAFFLGGALVYETVKPAVPAERPANVARTAPRKVPAVQPALKAPPEDLLLHDAWQSDELRQFHSVVEWEAWTPDTQPAKGDSSL
jgi:hypothetical protein